MEQSLKARLIGAVVLVALAVLLIPELLSGRKAAEPVAEESAGSRGTRTFTIELGQPPGQAARSPATSPSPAPSPTPAITAPAKAEDEPAAESPVEPQVETVAEQPPAPAPATPRAEPKPAPVSSSPGGGWAVQVGAFGSVDTARRMAQDLSGAGYRAFVSPVKRDGKTLYRVRVGPEGNRAAAEQLVPRLKARGLPATIVQND